VIEGGGDVRDLVASVCGRACAQLTGAKSFCRSLELTQSIPRRREDHQRGDGRRGKQHQCARE
jgi:hypothetical protein